MDIGVHICFQIRFLFSLEKYPEVELLDSMIVWASLVAQVVKPLLEMREAWVQSLGWEDPLEKEWQPTPVLLPGKFHGLRSLVGYSLWGCKESDTT